MAKEKTESFRKKLIVFIGPRDRRQGILGRVTWERHQGDQEAEDSREV